MTPIEEYLSAGQAAAFMGVHRDTIRRWADSGELPCVRSPIGHRLFLTADLQLTKDQRSEGPS